MLGVLVESMPLASDIEAETIRGWQRSSDWETANCEAATGRLRDSDCDSRLFLG
jgi:hypothetical protein